MNKIIRVFALFLTMITLISIDISAKESKKPFTFEDIMKSKRARMHVISDYGNWAGYTVMPDRGDANSYIISLTDTAKKREYVINRGGKIEFAKDEQWAATLVSPKAIDLENAGKDKSKLKKGLTLIDLNNGEKIEYDDVKSFKFSEDGHWIAFEQNSEQKEYGKDIAKKPKGLPVVLKHLASGTDIRLDWVTEFQFDSLNRSFIFNVSDPTGKKDGIYFRDLTQAYAPQFTIIKGDSNYIFGNLAWQHDINVLAFTKSKKTKKGYPDSTNLCIWLRGNDQVIDVIENLKTPKGWYIPYGNELKWTDKGERLFFGFKPIGEKDTVEQEEKENKFNETNFFDVTKILKDKNSNVWHWNDDKISTHQINWWQKNKNRTFKAVYHIKENKWVQLADSNLTDVEFTSNPFYTVGYDEKPYTKEQTYNNFYHDAYLINIHTGEKFKFATKILEPAYLTPVGKKVAFFKSPSWTVFDDDTKQFTNLTRQIKSDFFNNESELPAEPQSYGFFGWAEGNEAIYVYDKYELWKLDTDGIGFLNMFGRDGKIFKYRYRLHNFHWDKKYIGNKDTMLVSIYGYHDRWHKMGYMTMDVSGAIHFNTGNNKMAKLMSKAKYGNRYIYTREAYDEYPDLWTATLTPLNEFNDTLKITNIYPELKDFEWGKSIPYKWANAKGDTIEGYLVTPYNFDSTKKYPMLVYIYETFSESTYEFYHPRMSHRPCYQLYNSNGYLVFVPDIHYPKAGSPGDNALDCVTSGVKMLISKGFVDPKKIALQGHSWGAYQTAYIATQTDMFAACCAGAPVGNMTSAYSAIRTESGLARQFQYEGHQSRIGGNLWDSLSSYIRNSPVFQAQKAVTPLLILHGDVDGAVPWHQSVEIFLAYRRLNKPCIFIHYENEPHWPDRYPNRIDWALKMQEFFDTYCLGKPAPKWISEGEPYFKR